MRELLKHLGIGIYAVSLFAALFAPELELTSLQSALVMGACLVGIILMMLPLTTSASIKEKREKL